MGIKNKYKEMRCGQIIVGRGEESEERSDRQAKKSGPSKAPIRVNSKNVHWLIGRSLSYRLHVSMRRGKNDFDHFDAIDMGWMGWLRRASGLAQARVRS